MALLADIVNTGSASIPTPGTGRTSRGKRYLHLKYKAPFIGEDFVNILDLLINGITGVYSSN